MSQREVLFFWDAAGLCGGADEDVALETHGHVRRGVAQVTHARVTRAYVHCEIHLSFEKIKRRKKRRRKKKPSSSRAERRRRTRGGEADAAQLAPEGTWRADRARVEDNEPIDLEYSVGV